MLLDNFCQDVRKVFIDLYNDKEFIVYEPGTKVIEILGASFIADEDSIFGIVERDYAFNDIIWYQYNFNEQYSNALTMFNLNPNSHRVFMNYVPSLHLDCYFSNSIQYLIRDRKIHAIVNARSNNACVSYQKDKAFQKYVLSNFAEDLGVEPGLIHWRIGSLYILEKDFWQIDCFAKFQKHLTRKEYREAIK